MMQSRSICGSENAPTFLRQIMLFSRYHITNYVVQKSLFLSRSLMIWLILELNFLFFMCTFPVKMSPEKR